MSFSGEQYFAVIVGAGLSGATLAERIATRLGKRVLVVDRRDHVAGNVFDEVRADSGLLESRYGAHLFHTDDEPVWRYLQAFATWRRWDHRVVTWARAPGGDVDRLVPVPANITTVNALFGADLRDEAEMREWMAREREGQRGEAQAANSEEVALARVGPRLYAALFRDYTLKQWGVGARALEPDVLRRIPVRESFDDRYFPDRFQALPEGGYAALVGRMLAHPLITVRLGTDFFEHRAALEAAASHWLIYTGPVDAFFPDAGLPKLEYRSIRFSREVRECSGFAQANSVVNFARADVPFTRTIEYKHFLHQASPKTALVSETTADEGEPFYPLPTRRNVELHAQYQALVRAAEARATAPRVRFVGRLATYKYINMDAAVKLALALFEELAAAGDFASEAEPSP
jgi:UDP-galactopyranose mutase